MSHNVRLEGVAFKDLAILEKAVNELIKEGTIDGRFEKGDVKIRGWRGSKGEGITYGNTAWDKEMNHQCPAGIVFNGGKYDIGFQKDADGSYVPFMESSFISPLAPDAGAKSVSGESITAHATHALPGQLAKGSMLGKLSQRYAVLMAERNARIKGIGTRRAKAADGQIQLICTHK